MATIWQFLGKHVESALEREKKDKSFQQHDTSADDDNFVSVSELQQAWLQSKGRAVARGCERAVEVPGRQLIVCIGALKISLFYVSRRLKHFELSSIICSRL